MAGYKLNKERELLGERLHQWRMVLGLTAQQVADRAGITRDTLRKLETGDTSVRAETLLQVLRALGQLDGFLDVIDPLNHDLGRIRAHRLNRKRAR